MATYTLILDDNDRFTLGNMFKALADLDSLNENEIALLRKVEALEADPPVVPPDDYLR